MVAVAILAAGKGTRMRSDLPKVLHSLGGRSLVERVLIGCEQLQPERQLAIVGYQANRVKEALLHYPDLEFVEQAQQLGTGHAVQQLLPHLEDFEGDLLVLNGDVPLLRPETLKALLATHQHHQNAATILTAQIHHPQGYGRVFCDSNNLLKEIVEDRDCTDAQRQNRRVNAGIYCFNWPKLQAVLPKLQSNNSQQEYYITDAVNFLSPVMVYDVPDDREILGINDRRQLATAYQILQSRIKDEWMAAGVTIIDPDSVTIDDTVQIGVDAIIEPQTHLRGKTTIGVGSRIGPGSTIENSDIGDRVTILHSVVIDSSIGDKANIGPFAHIRQQATVGESCRVGNFVELKKSTLGDNTNVAHLSYIGDATVGKQVNIGAGTITVNYDGKHKHHTTIGNFTRIGSNNTLIAPLNLGNGVTTAAGSTISEDVPDDCLAIARSRQTIKPGWRPKWHQE
ncbi:bifunctional UDP-N-acetylglucosamine diphosphorylase/glucosamine-1-phosphate N-acetyltransferase GlmU [Chamaesiphon minutus]|uniref:Bifunctional protein GlmU n=1 Tax=Chamaesiphon minutus (strain ATCC 27169 / PCC 6605) TaxID=1173020 RepID=K9UHR0_CHAP6|nr:bifunctional UDP-N-acetylglucosamine diphosphorylase/glucosamine-1-phosphate N-acetyltransferase GlmU [Chamaesiphon minutus]AFY93986.1 UDP-N-acetylglucosamine diphosphorylase/glucosamine-1-phosphate N-acetyltransferase [Chamaesiphon minutus PCC 6605]